LTRDAGPAPNRSAIGLPTRGPRPTGGRRPITALRFWHPTLALLACCSGGRRHPARGHSHGATDDYGYFAAEDRVHVHDLHTTILHLLGLDHERLTYRHAGRDFRLTDVHGTVIRDILG
jgi:hypothetical protein